MRHVLAVLAAAVLGSTTMAAQPSSAAAQTQPPRPPDGSTVTVTGCLARGDAPGTFVLNTVKWNSMNTPSKDPAAHHEASAQRGRPVPPEGATLASNDALAPRETLRLAGAATRLKLDSHLGHTITATGMLARHDPVVAPGIVLPDPPPRATTPPTGSEPKEPPLPRILNLRSITHVAAGCK